MNERVQTGLEEEKLKYKRKIENIMKGKSKNLQDFLLYMHDLSEKTKYVYMCDVLKFLKFTGKEKEEMELQAIFKEAASYVPRFATFGTTWAKAYDVEWLRKQNIIYEPELRRGQDTVFNLHAFETAEKVLYVKRFLYHYRMNSGSTVNKYTEGTIDILERISRYILKFIKEHGKDERFYQAYNNKSIQLLSQSINSDYAHKNNPKSYLTRRKELKTVLRRKCYRDNFKNINTENIPVTRKLYWSLMKYRMVDLIYLAHWVYRKK